MKQEDKQLLLKDLSARLRYGVICRVEFKDSEGWKTQNMPLKGVFIDECYFSTDAGSIYSKEFTPYLRSISSMTEEEKKEWQYYKNAIAESCDEKLEERISELHNWFNKNMFDYRGLISKGLAIEVTKENNPYEKINL